MAVAVVVVSLSVLWNLVLLTAILAGLSPIIWRRRLWTTIEIALIALALFALMVFAPIAFNVETTSSAKLAILIASLSALAAGTLLTWLEYLVAGRRSRFRSDLGRSAWFGQTPGQFVDRG